MQGSAQHMSSAPEIKVGAMSVHESTKSTEVATARLQQLEQKLEAQGTIIKRLQMVSSDSDIVNVLIYNCKQQNGHFDQDVLVREGEQAQLFAQRAATIRGAQTTSPTEVARELAEVQERLRKLEWEYALLKEQQK